MKQTSTTFKVLSLLLLMMVSSRLAAQTDEPRFINQTSIGGFVSVGFPLYKLEDGSKYNPFIIGGSFHFPFYQSKKVFGLGMGLLPQFGFVPYNGKMEYEMGFNVTFTFGFQLADNAIFSINLGAGPHYYTADVVRQAPGFIFSDHLNLAYKHRLSSWEISLTAGIRHISNAGLEKPNRGIEDIGVGFAVGKLLIK